MKLFLKWASAFALCVILTIALSGSGVTSAAYSTIQNAGSSVTQRPTMNFVSGCTPADNSGANRTDITCSGGSALNIGINGGGTSTPTTLQLQQGSGCTITSAGSSTLTITIACGGGGGTSVHHQYFMAAGADTGGATRMMNVNSGVNGTQLANVPFGILGTFGFGGGGLAGVEVNLPSTWTGSITMDVDAMTSTNDTGNFSLQPEYFCIGNGYDLGASPSYTTGSAVSVAAPGGGGTGFYREKISLTLSGISCSAGNSIFLAVTRPVADTYLHSIYILGFDVGITY